MWVAIALPERTQSVQRADAKIAPNPGTALRALNFLLHRTVCFAITRQETHWIKEYFHHVHAQSVKAGGVHENTHHSPFEYRVVQLC